MGFSRFNQQTSAPSLVPLNQFPNNSTITDASLSTSSPFILPPRPGNRRGLIIENDGIVPMVFSLGTTVSVAARTAMLNPNDIYEDASGWQGSVAALSVGSSGAANFTEMVYI
jgi:hypothetical protein